VPYRDDDDAVLRRRQQLARDLASGRMRGRARGETEDEIEAIDAARLEAARVRLPEVARARIASPCHEIWEAMLGEGAIRSCARCDQRVFDLSQMTLSQAETLVAQHRGKLCVRLYRREDGTMMFADCVVGASGIVKRKSAIAATALAVGGTALAWMSAPPPPAPGTTTPVHATRDSTRVPGVAWAAPAVDLSHWHPKPYPVMGAYIGTGSDRGAVPHVGLGDAEIWDDATFEASRRGHLDVGLPIPSSPTTLGVRVLHRALLARRRVIRACYERALALDPVLGGRMIVALTIRASGAVTDVAVTRAILGAESVAACVVETLSHLRFDDPPQHDVTYEVPIDFTHARRSGERG
jgi:hypothetical protein